MIDLGETDVLLKLAESAAISTGQFLKDENMSLRKMAFASGHDIKIDADRKAERMIVERLKEGSLFSIFSEEAGYVGDKKAAIKWIVDPLDGSMNYHKNIPFCGISIALCCDEKPVLGVVYDFNRQELFSGIVGKGAWLNHESINPSKTKDISSAVLGTGFPVNLAHSTEVLSGFIAEIQRYKKIRLLGSAALTLCYVACGRIDAYHEKNIMFWDVAAGCAIIQAAGGKVKTMYNSAEKPLEVYASNGFL